ncbi:hypothetical protein C8C77_103178 [Halanaerobium saccharolyticum]|uniref:Cohesin domain-containing protein n=1 Tax=Halanaerobium saccharolyticum TaxID=43595 RepID=A0A4R7Z6N4_9FIRM|nr:hypothetical protein [Halanaerobium saccharolyticum]RAK11190.1 hypothetical protein C7958_103178 [Halanaerobium saccharolyticum]TDW07041.1 hypothetical protein C8C77_103178 [Halanaerobium saccharolyticum]TDX63806.1 hypothetical protein C7956_102178 [Halanaerobium saccharolyticum]
MYKYRKILIIALLIILVFSFKTAAQNNFFQNEDEHNNLRFGNEYIVIVVNQNENSQGRFAVETTGGAPARENDDNKPLIYGRPNPWTSYTSLWINEEKYVFGGTTERRAGDGAKYGEVIQEPTVEDNQIITKTRFDNIVVEQILSIVKSSTTGLADSAQIQYRVINEGDQEEKVGLRVMLDTMLGENDGAPFRLGEDTISTDKLYYNKQLDDFWQAFDSVSNPQVTSQGSFIGPDVSTPDRVYFSDWGSLADGVWDFDFNPGQEFIRKGEYEIDSAMAMYWVPEMIEPGESKTYITKYGLGGITIVPGILSLGVTSPAEVTLDENNQSFPVVAYLENTSEINARNVSIEIELPDNFSAEEASRNLGDMAPEDISQITWNVRADNRNNLPEEMTYRVIVDADNTDSNEVERRVEFLGPPELNANITLMEEVESVDGRLEPNPFRIQAEINNSGETSLYGVEAELILPPGLVTASSEKSKKNLGILRQEEIININWAIEALRVDGTLPFALKVSGLNNYQKTIVEEISLPELRPLILLRETKGQQDENYYSVDIVAANIAEAENISFELNYNSDNLLLTHISRGDFFVGDNNLLPFNRPDRSEIGKVLFNQEFPFNKANGVIATVHFKLKEDSPGSISIDNLEAVNGPGNPFQIKIRNILEEEN